MDKVAVAYGLIVVVTLVYLAVQVRRTPGSDAEERPVISGLDDRIAAYSAMPTVPDYVPEEWGA